MSRLQFSISAQKYDLLILLSGPEPQRTLFENKLLKQSGYLNKKILFVRGLPGEVAEIKETEGITFKNHLSATELGEAINESAFVICRSGYTTVMDLCKLRKESLLIPTPGQTEQEYLAKHLEKQGWCLATNQQDFHLEKAIKLFRNLKIEMPALNMEKYKVVVHELINNLKD